MREMRGFRSEMERDMKLEQDMLRQCETELAHASKGGLVCYVKKGRIYFKYIYYLRGNGEKKSTRMERHLGREDEVLIRALQRKACLKRMKAILEKNLEVQNFAVRSYSPYDYHHIMESAGAAYQIETLELFLQQRWQNHEAKPAPSDSDVQNAFRQDGLTQMTAAGFRVRSKSEALIANSLYENRIVFFYEKEIRVKLETGETVLLHPDFAILLPSGELILWEHLGLLRKKEYALKFGEKLHFYNLAGYTPGINLILTADDVNGSLDMQAVARIIDWLKTICQKR